MLMYYYYVGSLIMFFCYEFVLWYIMYEGIKII